MIRNRTGEIRQTQICIEFQLFDDGEVSVPFWVGHVLHVQGVKCIYRKRPPFVIGRVGVEFLSDGGARIRTV